MTQKVIKTMNRNDARAILIKHVNQVTDEDNYGEGIEKILNLLGFLEEPLCENCGKTFGKHGGTNCVLGHPELSQFKAKM